MYKELLAIFAFLVTLGVFSANAQEGVPTIPDSAIFTIITKVPFNGRDYFIAIAPLDSTNIDNMPIVSPYVIRRKGARLIDSLEGMIQDSLIQRFPQREDFLKPQKPDR
jgi:hypothetical protein